MTLDAQVLVVAFLALLLGLIIECTKREVVEKDKPQHWRDLAVNAVCLEYKQERVQAAPLATSVRLTSMD